MIQIPALRFGREYVSLEKSVLTHHKTGEPLAELSLVTGSMIARDLNGISDIARELRAIPIADLFAISKKAAELFLEAPLPCGDAELTFQDYIKHLSATTGSPQVFCERNARKVHHVLAHGEEVLDGLTRGLDHSVFDRGYVASSGRMAAFHPTTDVFGAVLPSNSPGVHALWVPAIVMKTPLLLKPGREEPWTPYRVAQAFIRAGLPAKFIGVLPTDHAGSADILRLCGRSMAFGDDRTMAPYKNDPRVEIHGTGYSKILLADDVADRWEEYLDLMVESIAGNGGRACVNASGIWTSRHADAIAEALARRLANVTARDADDPECAISAFANPNVAVAIHNTIEEALRTPGAVDVTEKIRGSSRLVRDETRAWLLPTIVRCESAEHPLADKEFLFPFASVVETADILGQIGYTLAATLLTENPDLVREAMNSHRIDRLNIGPVPTNRLTWNQPHEGNLFDHLYKRRALQFPG